MYYFLHPNGETATCEAAALIPGLEARGYQRCTPVEHRTAWQARDTLRRLEGDIPPPGWVEGQVEVAPEVRRDVVYPSYWKH